MSLGVFTLQMTMIIVYYITFPPQQQKTTKFIRKLINMQWLL